MEQGAFLAGRFHSLAGFCGVQISARGPARQRLPGSRRGRHLVCLLCIFQGLILPGVRVRAAWWPCCTVAGSGASGLRKLSCKSRQTICKRHCGVSSPAARAGWQGSLSPGTGTRARHGVSELRGCWGPWQHGCWGWGAPRVGTGQWCQCPKCPRPPARAAVGALGRAPAPHPPRRREVNPRSDERVQRFCCDDCLSSEVLSLSW